MGQKDRYVYTFLIFTCESPLSAPPPQSSSKSERAWRCLMLQ
jgi:hypothetical protein